MTSFIITYIFNIIYIAINLNSIWKFLPKPHVSVHLFFVDFKIIRKLIIILRILFCSLISSVLMLYVLRTDMRACRTYENFFLFCTLPTTRFTFMCVFQIYYKYILYLSNIVHSWHVNVNSVCLLLLIFFRSQNTHYCPLYK